MNNKAIGRRIKQYRKESGYTQEDLAEMIPLSVGFLSAIERGAGSPSIDTFVNIVNCIGASADEILVDVIYKSCRIKESWILADLNVFPEEVRRYLINEIRVLIEFHKRKYGLTKL